MTKPPISMDLIFIGTSSGRTSLDRFHSSILFRSEAKSILIDSGDGVSRALKTGGVEINSITDIIISHFHADHIAGLPSLLTQMIIQNRTKALSIYLHTDLIQTLQSFLFANFLFSETFSFNMKLIGYDFTTEMILSDSFKFLAKQNSHIKNKHNLNIEKQNFISSSFLFWVNGSKIVYTSDVGCADDLYLFNNEEADILIVETTHIQLKKIEEAVIILDMEKVYLTHIDNDKEVMNWYDNLANETKQKIIIAEDGMLIEI